MWDVLGLTGWSVCGRRRARPRRSRAVPHGLTRRLNKGLGCERGAGDIYSGKSMAPMFVEVSVAFVEPRGQYHNFLICLDGATWMASTVFFEARLAICLRVKLSCVSGAIAAHVTIPLPWSHAARSRRKSQLSYKYYIDYIYIFFQDICSGRLPRIHHFTSDTNRLVGCPEFTISHRTQTGWNGRNEYEQPSCHSNPSNKVEIS